MKRLYILTSVFVGFIFYSCMSHEENLLISCDKIIICPEALDKDSLYFVLTFKNTSERKTAVFTFLNPLDSTDKKLDRHNNKVIYSIMIEIDSINIYLSPLFMKDGYVEIPPKEQIKLLFMTANAMSTYSDTDYKRLKDLLSSNGEKEDIKFSLIEFSVRSGEKGTLYENNFMPSFDISGSKQIINNQ